MPPPKKLSSGFGRIREEWPPIPPPARYRVDAIRRYLHATRNVRRPPDTLDWVLTVVCEMELKGYYWPNRRRLANALAAWKDEPVILPYTRRPRFVDSIDSAVASAIVEDDIREEYRVTEGSHATRSSLHRHRYMRPSAELMAAYLAAERDSSNAYASGTRKLAAIR